MPVDASPTERLSAPVVKRLRETELAIAEALLDPSGRQTVLETFERLLDLKMAALKRPVRVPESGWGFEVLEYRGVSEASVQKYLRFCGSTATAFVHYDPLRPEAAQRNQVHTQGDLIAERGPSAMLTQVIPSIGLGGHDQLRALLCDGPLLLGWIGGFRERPFEEEDRIAFGMLVPRLRSWLLVERMLRDADVASRGVAAALEGIAAPALLLDDKGRVVHTNAMAQQTLVDHPNGSALRQALLNPRTAGWHTTEMSLQGEPKQRVAICFAASALESRLDSACSVWGVSKRQRDVLRLLARGDANKRIAEKLGISEVTVEAHITAILRKSHASSRTDLAARVWSGVFEGLP